MKEQLKLYVWENVLTDHTSGMICILAYDLEQAKKLLLEKYDDYYANDFGRPHKVITTETARF